MLQLLNLEYVLQIGIYTVSMIWQIIGWSMSVVSAIGILLTPRLRCNEVCREGLGIAFGLIFVFALGFSLAAIPFLAHMSRSWRFTGLIAILIYVGLTKLSKYISRGDR